MLCIPVVGIAMETVNILTLLKENPEGSFLEFASLNGKSFGTCDLTGKNPGWEMHPDTDEFFYIIEGEVEITLLDEGGPHHHFAPAGTSFVVPRGIWHKPEAPNGAKFIFFTPGQSLQSEADDPRLDA